MANAPRGLGRGLDSLFRNQPEPATVEDGLQQLSLASIRPNAEQPRRTFDEHSLDELAESIRQQGLLQPILVRPLGDAASSFEIIAGERRWRAAQLAGLSEIPAIVRELSDEEAMLVALVENLQREDLNPLEEAEGMHALRQKLGLSQEELAARLGKSRSGVANSLRLLQLDTPMREALRQNEISPGHARTLLALPQGEARDTLFAALHSKRLSVRDAEAAVLAYKERGVFPSVVLDALNDADSDVQTDSREDNSSMSSFGPHPDTMHGAPDSTQDATQAATAADAAFSAQSAVRSAESEYAPRPSGQRPARLPKPEAVRAVQALLRTCVHPKTTVSGTGELGRVTIPYENAEQLSLLLERLGLSGNDHD